MISPGQFTNSSRVGVYNTSKIRQQFQSEYLNVSNEDNYVTLELALLGQRQSITIYDKQNQLLPEVFFLNEGKSESYNIPAKFQDAKFLGLDRDDFLEIIIWDFFDRVLSGFLPESQLKNDLKGLIKPNPENGVITKNEQYIIISFDMVTYTMLVYIPITEKIRVIRTEICMSQLPYEPFPQLYNEEMIQNKGLHDLLRESQTHFHEHKLSFFLSGCIENLKKLDFFPVDKTTCEERSPWYLGRWVNSSIYAQVFIRDDMPFINLKRADCRYENELPLNGRGLNFALDTFVHKYD